jgi:protein-S-isoprenylcysteine O-methyltransferase Ste14
MLRERFAHAFFTLYHVSLDFTRFLGGLLQSRSTLAAENLFLRIRTLDRWIGLALPARTAMLGIIVMALGGILILICIGMFVVRGRGTPAIFDAPRVFVAVGPYRNLRNPMYVGGWLVLSGFGLYQHSAIRVVVSIDSGLAITSRSE